MTRNTQRASQLLRARSPYSGSCRRHRLDPLHPAFAFNYNRHNQHRHFHDYFVTHLPSSSLHPDSRSAAGPRHQLPRSASKPHTPRSASEASPAHPTHSHSTSSSSHPHPHASRDTTVVRIPLRSAKHHFGVSVSRGQRPYNEDTHQAGVIEIPAFAKRNPVSVTSTRAPPKSPLVAYRERQQKAQEEAAKKQAEGKESAEDESGQKAAESASGDPQVFYFGVYDGHGGVECSDFLKDNLHSYIEQAAKDFELMSTLKYSPAKAKVPDSYLSGRPGDKKDFKEPPTSPKKSEISLVPGAKSEIEPAESSPPEAQQLNTDRAQQLEKSLISGWKELVGGYFRRFKPKLFSDDPDATTDVSTILTYAFLRADFEFVEAQARKGDVDADPVLADAPLNASDVLDSPSKRIGGKARFKGGSTCSIALVSTPTPVPFWHPSTPATLVVAHVGDTRILLCRTSDGVAVPVTTNHHPSNPSEARRLRRYAGNIVTDSFGEERMSGLANSRAFGDMQSKRIGVSAEPEIRRIEMSPAEYSFMVLVSDGISGTLSDQEVVDIVKEAKTPEQGARDVVSFGTEVSEEGDNATCICVRLGGWERREEGGLGSLGTRENRDYRKQEAADPRRRH